MSQIFRELLLTICDSQILPEVQAEPAANCLLYLVHATTGVWSGMATDPTTSAAAQQQKLEKYLAMMSAKT